MLKLGLQHDAIKFSTLINGFCIQIKISFLITYNTIPIKLLDLELNIVVLALPLAVFVKSSLPCLILGISNILIGAHCKEAMISEDLHTIDTMNKRVIARYVSKVEDIVDTMIK
ncbi:hypothetical protein CXB51_005589 [Gossypium anomalum]|uniref:Uncharacterized protein n=1 Tax=Gossypium anomalum TaxID=47600 RepID=A0A8J5ZFU5_9ROSI|nr:hypothetical protein CXB51_005589 [Gossypium anomalum]